MLYNYIVKGHTDSKTVKKTQNKITYNSDDNKNYNDIIKTKLLL